MIRIQIGLFLLEEPDMTIFTIILHLQLQTSTIMMRMEEPQEVQHQSDLDILQTIMKTEAGVLIKLLEENIME